MYDDLEGLRAAQAAVYEAKYRNDARRAGLWYDDAQAYATARLADPDLTLARWRKQNGK